MTFMSSRSQRTSYLGRDYSTVSMGTKYLKLSNVTTNQLSDHEKGRVGRMFPPLITCLIYSCIDSVLADL